jgi:hypothetical protein
MMNDAVAAEGSGHDLPESHGDERINRQLEDIVRILLEMEYGLRPASALDTVASPAAARRIRQLLHGAGASGPGPRRPARRRTVRMQVLSTRSSHPSAGVTEGVVVVACEELTRPYCVRLEQEGDRWRIVELAPPDAGLGAAVTEASRTGAVPIGADGMRRSSGPDGVPFSAVALPGEHVLPIEGAHAQDPKPRSKRRSKRDGRPRDRSTRDRSTRHDEGGDDGVPARTRS